MSTALRRSPAAPPVRLHAVRAKATAAFVVRGARRRRARALARYVAEGTPWAGRDALVAYRRHVGQAIADEHERDHALVSRARIRGLEHVEAARATGRGVVLATIHSSAMFSAIRHVVSVVGPVQVTAGPWFWRDGVWVGGPEHRAALEAEGLYLVPTDTVATTLPPLLAEGAWCMLMFDVPGPKPVRLAGKQAYVQPGIAKLAIATNSVILPCVTYVEGTRVIAHGEPLVDPQDFSGTRAERIDQVLTATAGHLDRALSARPHLWAPHTSVLWPDTVAPYLWAFEG